jgi:hypothetical protein
MAKVENENRAVENLRRQLTNELRKVLFRSASTMEIVNDEEDIDFVGHRRLSVVRSYDRPARSRLPKMSAKPVGPAILASISCQMIKAFAPFVFQVAC